MKKSHLFLLLAFSALSGFSAMQVQSLQGGDNVYYGTPGKVVGISVHTEKSQGSLGFYHMYDLTGYSNVTATVTNSFTNVTAWASETVTNRTVVRVDDYLTTTNAVYTNVVRGVTNVVYATRRIPNGSHLETNEVVVVRPIWTDTPVYLTGIVTNDAVSHYEGNHRIGQISVSGHFGTLTPTNVYFNTGDIIRVSGFDTNYVYDIRMYVTGD